MWNIYYTLSLIQKITRTHPLSSPNVQAESQPLSWYPRRWPFQQAGLTRPCCLLLSCCWLLTSLSRSLPQVAETSSLAIAKPPDRLSSRLLSSVTSHLWTWLSPAPLSQTDLFVTLPGSHLVHVPLPLGDLTSYLKFIVSLLSALLAYTFTFSPSPAALS